MLNDDNLPERKKNFQHHKNALHLIEPFNNSWILSHTTTCHATNAGAITHNDANNATNNSCSSKISVNMSDMACNDCINELQKICRHNIQLTYITLHLLEATSKYYYNTISLDL